MRTSTLILTVIASTASLASAQTIYEPLVTQFGGQNPYWYAGHDPRVHAAAAYPSMPGSSYGRRDGFAFVSDRRSVVERKPRIFADFLGPHWNPLTDLTPSDVINAANAALPRYFTKRDLIANDGGRVPTAPVNAQSTPRRLPTYPPGSIVIIHHRR